jgi:hypothetical protein
LVEHYCDLVPRLANDLRDLLASAGDAWAISSFWPGEVLLAAEQCFAGAARDTALPAARAAFSDIPPPKLLAYLESPEDLLLFSPTQYGAGDPYNEHAVRLANHNAELEAAVAATKVTPVLRTSAARPEAAIEEIVAAVLAMR